MNNTKSTDVIVDEALRERLEEVRVRYQLASLDQALEFLVRRRLRLGGEYTTGSRRALHIVKG